MSKPFFIANWKMKLSTKESVALASDIVKKTKKYQTAVEVVLCPQFVALPPVSQAITDSQIKLGAQDVFWATKGSYTGEVSPTSLVEAGCGYVILGHSERRKFLGETSEQVNKKIQAAVNAGLVPIVCIGDTLEDRQEGRSVLSITQQITTCFSGITFAPQQEVLVCYEPVWAISDNTPQQTIDSQQIEQMTQVLWQTLYDVISVDSLEKKFHLLYGGSVDSASINNFLQVEMIQGVLVGAASLSAVEVSEMVKIMSNQK